MRDSYFIRFVIQKQSVNIYLFKRLMKIIPKKLNIQRLFSYGTQKYLSVCKSCLI